MGVIEWVSALLTANPVLAGGIGTVAFGSAMYVLRALPQALYEAAGRIFWTEMFVESQSNEYGDVDAFIEKHRLGLFGRSLELKDGALKTGFGRGWGVYDGTLFRYAKAKAAAQIVPYETIRVAFLTRDRTTAERFIRDCLPDEHRNALLVTFYGANGIDGGLRRRKRSLDTVFVDRAVKERLLERLTWFLGAENWHAARGIPWKIGIVLHGPPGTGKPALSTPLPRTWASTSNM